MLDLDRFLGQRLEERRRKVFLSVGGWSFVNDKLTMFCHFFFFTFTRTINYWFVYEFVSSFIHEGQKLCFKGHLSLSFTTVIVELSHAAFRQLLFPLENQMLIPFTFGLFFSVSFLYGSVGCVYVLSLCGAACLPKGKVVIRPCIRMRVCCSKCCRGVTKTPWIMVSECYASLPDHWHANALKQFCSICGAFMCIHVSCQWVLNANMHMGRLIDLQADQEREIEIGRAMFLSGKNTDG